MSVMAHIQLCRHVMAIRTAGSSEVPKRRTIRSFKDWTSTDDYISWPIDVGETGTYEAIVYYTCAAGNEGATIELSCNDSSVRQTVDEVFDPPLYDKSKERVADSHYFVKDFKPLRLGTLSLNKGRGELRLGAVTKTGKGLIDVHSIDLNLVSAGKLNADKLGDTNWPQAAGPDGNWQVDGQAPTKWSVVRNENIRWRTPMPEAGMSAVTVCGDRVFTTTHVPIESEDQKNGVKDILGFCLDAETGQVLWQVELPGQSAISLAGGFTDGTVFAPICDGEHVWFFNRCGSIGCYDLNGNQVWLRQWTPRFKHNNRQCEPFLVGDTLALRRSRQQGRRRDDAEVDGTRCQGEVDQHSRRCRPDRSLDLHSRIGQAHGGNTLARGCGDFDP